MRLPHSLRIALTSRVGGRAAIARTGTSRAAWAWLTALLALAMLINYADRGSLSVVAPLLADTMRLNGAQVGVLLSAFFWSYGLAHPFAGWVAQRYDVRVVLAVGLTAWAGATAACGLAAGFVSLLALRLVVGVGESVIFPSTARILAEHAPADQRGAANGVVLLGQFLGPAVGALAGGLILARFGWRAVFVGLGAVSLVWLIPWLTTRLGPISRPPAEPPTPPPRYGELLASRGLWGVSLGQFCYAWTHYLLLTWLPLYLVKGLGLSLAGMAVVGSANYALQSLGALLSGALSDLAIRRGLPAPTVRKVTILIGVVGQMAGMGLVAVLPRPMTLPALAVGCFFNGWTSTMVFTIGQTLAGPSAGGRWMGVQNTSGQLSGILAPIVTGVLVDRTGSFAPAFAVAAALSMIGLGFWAFLTPRVEAIRWRGRVAPLIQGEREAVQAAP